MKKQNCHNYPPAKIFSQNSIQIANHTIQSLLDQFIIQLKSKAAMLKVPKFSSQYAQNIVYAMIETQVIRLPQISQINIDNEPIPLISDVMMSGLVGIKHLQYQNTIQQIQQDQQEIKDIKQQEKKRILKWNQTECIRISRGSPQNQQERMIRFLRQKWLISNVKNQKQITIKNRLKHLSIKDISMQTFDYNGKMLKLRQKKAKNLVDQKLEFDIKNQQILKFSKKNLQNKPIQKEQIIINLQNIITNQTTNLQKKQINQIQFEDRSQFPGIQPSKGVKLITETKIEQNLVKSLSTEQIKNKIKEIKLTKDQYYSIKNNKVGLQYHRHQDQNNIITQKALKTVISTLPTLDDQLLTKKYRSIELSSKNTSKIKIDNHQLKDFLLQQDQQKTDSQIKFKKSNSLDRKMNETIQKQLELKVDKHLDFLLNRSKTKVTINKPLILPQIKKKQSDTCMNKKNNFSKSLKIREKLKNQSQILLQERKNYYDKLRQSYKK